MLQEEHRAGIGILSNPHRPETMAQAGLAPAASDDGTTVNGVGERSIYEIQQYDKILRFRDSILSGSHPNFKTQPSGQNAENPHPALIMHPQRLV